MMRRGEERVEETLWAGLIWMWQWLVHKERDGVERGFAKRKLGCVWGFEAGQPVLQMSNYALNVHLRQAQEGTSMPSRFNPDIF